MTAVKDAFNAVSLDCDIVGHLQFYGQGAGKLPTGDAVVSDIIDIITEEYKKFDYVPNPEVKLGENSLFNGLYYLRVSLDKNDKDAVLKEFENSSVKVKSKVVDNDLIILTEKISSEVIEEVVKEKLALDQSTYAYLRIESEVLNKLDDVDF